MGKYEEMIGNKKWTKERCLKLISDVKDRGSAEVAREEGYKDSESLRAILKSYSERFGVLDIYDEMIGAKLMWTKERCLKLISDVKNHGSAEVAREEGYKDSKSLINILRIYSERFGVRDIYDEMIGKELVWTKERCLKLISDVKDRGSAEVAREEGYKDSTSLINKLRTYSERFGVRDVYDEMIGEKKWTKERCIKLINDVKDHGSAEVARKEGYKDSESLRAILKSYSERFGVIDVYDEMIGKKRERK